MFMDIFKTCPHAPESCAILWKKMLTTHVYNKQRENLPVIWSKGISGGKIANKLLFMHQRPSKYVKESTNRPNNLNHTTKNLKYWAVGMSDCILWFLVIYTCILSLHVRYACWRQYIYQQTWDALCFLLTSTLLHTQTDPHSHLRDTR